MGEAPALGPGKPPEGYNMLDDHAQALDLVLTRADAQQLPLLGPAFLRELAAAVMHSTGRITNTVLGTVGPTQGDLRRTNVFIAGATSFPNAQKVLTLVATPIGKLREPMLGWGCKLISRSG